MAISSPQNLLQRLLKEPKESAWVEFKHNNNNPDEIGQWISACANAAILVEQPRAFLVYGVEDTSRTVIGTNVSLHMMKKGGENFENWINRMIIPRLMIDLLDFEVDGKKCAIIVIEPTYDRPVKFAGTEYIRVGENVRKLADHPEHERAIWLATGRRKFEDAIASAHQNEEQVIEKLDVDTYYRLAKEEKPQKQSEIIRRFLACGFIVDDMEGGFDITNRGAIIFARNITIFPSIASKSIRVIRYKGTDKRESIGEIEGRKGYAVGFAGLMKYITDSVPSQEKYINGIRTMEPIYPETAIREIIANALIHQDFVVTGAGPVIEIYSDRIEVTNPGKSLVERDRMIDERRSRNGKLAESMRSLGLCEERGGGLDKALIVVEEKNLPAFALDSSDNSMRVTLFVPKKFNQLTKPEKQWACFLHCVLRYVKKDYMSNASLRERFSLPPEEYQAVSAIISESIKKKRIVPADAKQGNKFAKYVPYFTR
jgi:predicted HTH transcriptional regulator